jgi:phosphohistidine phosphatase
MHKIATHQHHTILDFEFWILNSGFCLTDEKTNVERGFQKSMGASMLQDKPQRSASRGNATMELYMIRHGLAGEHGTYANDEERPLTQEGKRKTKQVAQRLLELDIQFDLIQTSPLVRAQQTAEILQAVGLGHSLEDSVYLKPNGDMSGWLTWLQDWRNRGNKTLAIVGHEPDLSQWAERLVWGEPRHNLVLKKAGVIGLLLPDDGPLVGRSQLFWFTPPRLLI